MTALLAIALFATTPGVALDSTAALARARALRPVISAGNAAALWPEFGPKMKTAMKDSVAFTERMARMGGQLGAIESVAEERLEREGTDWVYRARCRMANLPVPVLFTLALGDDGAVTGMTFRPAEPAGPYPSPHLDYQTKTPLRLPFSGEWTVYWGGRTLEQNYHAASKTQRFAHDLIVVRDSTTHRGEGKRLQDYFCYGLEVLAPAAGTVAWLQDSLPDQEIGTSNPAAPIGNGVILDHGNGEFSLLAHLQPGSLTVKKGDAVREGQKLGLVGNSGNTSEPHLHYHLQNGTDPRGADGLPAFFNDLVVDGAEVARAELLRGQRVRRKAGK